MLHDSFLTHEVVVRLVITLLVLHILCWGLVYFMAFQYRLISYPYWFLSAAFAWDPSRAIAAFFIPIISVLTGMLLWIRSKLLRPRLKSAGHKMLLKAYNVCSVIVCLGLLGVSAISIETNIYVHLVFAFALFISGIHIMILSTVMDSVLHLPVPPLIRVVRYALTAVAVVSGILLGVCFVPYPFFGSLMEMVSVGAMTAYFCTFASRFDRLAAECSSSDELECSSDHRFPADEPRKMWWLRVELFPGEKQFVQALLVLLLFLRLSLLASVYILSGVQNKIAYPNIGVNVAIQEDPSRAIAAFVLPISAMLILVVVLLRLRRISFIVHTGCQWAVWTIIFVSSFFVYFGLLGIGCVSLLTNAAVSYSFAGMWYVSSVVNVVGLTFLNHMVQQIAPLWLIQLRIIFTILVVCFALGLAVTIGWVPQASWIIEILLSVSTVLYLETYAHSSDFPIRSYCPFAYPASVPP